MRSAAQGGRKKECIYMIQNGADINCQENIWNVTPLHDACQYKHFDVASLLVRHGADVNLGDCIGNSPLYYAAKNGCDCIVQLLLDNGSNVNSTCKKGRTPLHIAMQNGNCTTCLLLIEKGGDPFMVDSQGLSPCHLALRAGTFKQVACLFLVLQAQRETAARNISKIVNPRDKAVSRHVLAVVYHWVKAIRFGTELKPISEAEFNKPRCSLGNRNRTSRTNATAPPSPSQKPPPSESIASISRTSSDSSATVSLKSTCPPESDGGKKCVFAKRLRASSTVCNFAARLRQVRCVSDAQRRDGVCSSSKVKDYSVPANEQLTKPRNATPNKPNVSLDNATAQGTMHLKNSQTCEGTDEDSERKHESGSDVEDGQTYDQGEQALAQT